MKPSKHNQRNNVVFIKKSGQEFPMRAKVDFVPPVHFSQCFACGTNHPANEFCPECKR